ncbi:COG2426 family protein [Brassicibacter mesophilus]|uniref:COG2426 family protein n=1 Tax=Brassicibacter mesophilus TaxID=745119 RepID=UPI003D24A78E
MQNIFDILSKEIMVLLTAALPIIELRGAIPFGVSLGLSPWHAFLISFLGSMIPVPILLFTVRPIFNYLKKTKTFKKMINRLTNKTLNRSGRIQKYGFWGLILFVGIPLPGTGVWSGVLAASLLDMRFKLVFPAIFIGNLIAGIIMMLLSNGALRAIDIFG